MTVAIALPIDPENPSGNFLIALDGVDYRFRFQYFSRLECWTASIYTSADEPIVVGQRVVSNYPLFDVSNDPRLPGGTFVAIDSRDEPKGPGAGDLGDAVQVEYASSGELT